MNLLPKASGSRPRLACEIAAVGVVAARSPEPGMPLASVAKVDLPDSAVIPSLKPGNILDRVSTIAALRRALEHVGMRANARNADLTLVIPDAAVRVLLLEFDSLPNKLSEALPLVRFRLKKLIPFEPDDAMVSFQVMSTARNLVRVLAVAIPRDVLTEYESIAREAGFEPGAVLPSTLAALASFNEGDGASLIVNAHSSGVTTAIVRAGILLLHRSIELAEAAPATPANLPPALFDTTSQIATSTLPLVDRDESVAEWAAQEPLPEYGRNPYAEPGAVDVSANGQGDMYRRRAQAYQTAASEGFYDRGEPAPVSQSPYISPTSTADLDAQLHHAVLMAPTSPGTLTDPALVEDRSIVISSGRDYREPPTYTLSPDAQAEEIAGAVSVAVAYFEDTLGAAPQVLLNAGSLGAEGLQRMLREQGIADQDGLRVRELIDSAEVSAAATSASVPRSWLAGVVGALKS